MGYTISIVFHPFDNPKEHFIKTLGMFEVANIIPHLDYIITGHDIDPFFQMNTLYLIFSAGIY